jgi:hypothetical protein
MEDWFIINQNGTYAVVKTVTLGEHVVSRVVKAELKYNEAQQFLEDAPAMAASAGHIASIGIGPQGEPPAPLRSRKLIRRLKQLVK